MDYGELLNPTSTRFPVITVDFNKFSCLYVATNRNRLPPVTIAILCLMGAIFSFQVLVHFRYLFTTHFQLLLSIRSVFIFNQIRRLYHERLRITEVLRIKLVLVTPHSQNYKQLDGEMSYQKSWTQNSPFMIWIILVLTNTVIRALTKQRSCTAYNAHRKLPDSALEQTSNI